MIKKNAGFTVFALLVLFLFAGCSSTSQSEEGDEKDEQPILVQGPMPIEAEEFAERLDDVEEETSGNFVFYKGTVDDYPVIVAKTGKGMENTAAATTLAIEKYDPKAIINQGTSGGHDPDLNVYDIVLGERTTNIGALKTGDRDKGEGIEATEWIPMDLMASEGSAGEDPDAENIRYYKGDQQLLEAAQAVKDTHEDGKVVEGTIGSADLWNNEVDRIEWFHEKYETSVEEMEGAAGAQMADAYDVPYLGIRILSNNKTNDGEYDPDTAQSNQAYVYEVVKEYISTQAE
ncbi:5'-methylthioadenosine/S-adenosylhomocysteine nucleosidase [Halobacillus sp. A5]|uniref:5'-methylthioadenosine/S-adenosylhomocysteine nucleosidase n=1 Tax=Halobacillus sp. A5 TaxID=2880263 RepID=UPI0020A637E6|nr:5'-methylthioadenosine/S-adenosylhomocysteine nucleosidase [Halobacillus sp. A5]MCP3028535.1 5'-methylthioadenosine/S-adenosylhomocysteine nucleosidase [Halobacillus sp. A5]